MNATELRIPYIPIPLPATMDDADLIPCACVLVYGDTAALDGKFGAEIRDYLKTSVTPWLRDLVEKFK